MILCQIRIRGRLCVNVPRYRVTTLADTFLACAEHVGPWRVRPTARVEALA